MLILSDFPYFTKNNKTPLQKVLFPLVLTVFSALTALAQGPAGYTFCTNEGGSFTLPARSHVAYGADSQFFYLYNQTGTITFNNATFGDPTPGYPKAGYYKIANSEENIASLTSAFQQLKDHISGTTPLIPEELISIGDTIRQNIFVLGDTFPLLLLAFDVVNCYDSIEGPLFVNPNTQNGFFNNFTALDGKELDKAVFLVQQGIMDYAYSHENFPEFKPFLVGRKFKTADFFPGLCPNPVDSSTTYTAKINGSMPTEWGKRTAWSSSPARRPTGYYLAPGTMGTVKVPEHLVNKGFVILVGAHTVNRQGNNQVKRLFRVTNTFPIVDTLTQIVNPFGGGIYILTPYEAAEGIVEIQLTNVVPAPFFSAKISETTTLEDWLTVQRNNPAPWADFETDKFMMQVPTSWIYNYADPVALMQDWDDRMDVVSTLLGYPHLRNNTLLYLQVDLGIQHNGFYGIGNPQVNNTYNPLETENGNKNHWFLRPGVSFWETEFHEMGHAQLFSKFPGETEALVNFLSVAIYNRLYGMDIDTAFGNSFDPHPYRTRDQAALNWMVTPNFRAENPMDISNTTKDEVRYQHRGYGKYVEMAALFGWETIHSFYKQEQLDFINQTPSDGLTDVDSRILRFSKAAGTDMRPLIHFWGVHPKDSLVLANRILEDSLKPSRFICERLEHYKSIIPLSNTEFAEHAAAFFGGAVPAGGDPDYGSGWYNVWLPLYNETHGALAVEAMENIIQQYFPDGCPTDTLIPILIVNNPMICAGDSVVLIASGATTYTWSNGAEGDRITVAPSTTTFYTVVGKTAGFPSGPTIVQVTVNPIPVINLNNDSVCLGASVILTPSGAESYVWENGDTTNSLVVSPTMTTTYAVTGLSAGCPSASVNAVVDVNDLPVVNLGPDILLLSGQDTILDATGPDLTYLWSTGETTPTITINQGEIYGVTVSNAAGCSSSDTVEVVSITSAISQQSKYAVKIVPNPTQDLLYIICNGSSTSVVEVFDNLGRVVFSDHSFVQDGAMRKLDLSKQEVGMYYVRIADEGWTQTFPVLKF